jgi:hypothetical protein
LIGGELFCFYHIRLLTNMMGLKFSHQCTQEKR